MQDHRREPQARYRYNAPRTRIGSDLARRSPAWMALLGSGNGQGRPDLAIL